MEDKIIVIFDDTNEKSEVIKDVIGGKGFGDVIVKKRRLESYFYDSLKKIFSRFSFISIKSFFEFNDIIKKVECFDDNTRILHFFSNFMISDVERSALALKKILFIKKTYRILSENVTSLAIFKNPKGYIKFLNASITEKSTFAVASKIEDSFEIEGLTNIGIIRNFIQVVTGNFDSRYFNSLHGDDYRLVKSSANKKKIKAEYTFYQLLPEDMKFWFVMPFNYKEDDEKASYSMERLHTTDLAIKWVHGSIDRAEFSKILDKYFFFFKSRHSRDVSKGEYEKISQALYVDKVKERLDCLKKLSAFEPIASLMKTSCVINDVDLLFARYLLLKEKIEHKNNYSLVSVIGHGDPCFANVMYNKSTELLKFIDPKGALCDEELWTNPYYDIAKLSHSVCGCYDFFNNALFDININEEFKAELKINFDNSTYKEIFRNKLTENGFDYLSVRIYEASLFISMLPLHIDYPYKVFGFILNAINILEEIENEI